LKPSRKKAEVNVSTGNGIGESVGVLSTKEKRAKTQESERTGIEERERERRVVRTGEEVTGQRERESEAPFGQRSVGSRIAALSENMRRYVM
jgi:hypothetical protein